MVWFCNGTGLGDDGRVKESLVRILSVVLSVLITMSLNVGHADAQATSESKWQLEIDSNYTCVGTTGVSYNHTDTHKGSVSFVLPEVSGKVKASGGDYHYHSIGQTMGNPWELSTPGELTFEGEVVPGILRFTPQVYLPDGRAFFDPSEPIEIPIFDGATAKVDVASVEQVACEGAAIYTLRGAPIEKYTILVDDRLLTRKFYGQFSGLDYYVGATAQVLTEIEIVIEGKEVKSATGMRRLGRTTPYSNPSEVWNINTVARECPDGRSYPHAPKLSDGQVNASVRNETTISLFVPAGDVGVAAEWTIIPEIAKVVSPDIQQGDPKIYNGDWCAVSRLSPTRWSFTRGRNSTTITDDTADHFQVFTVTQATTAGSAPSNAATTERPRPMYFVGDASP